MDYRFIEQLLDLPRIRISRIVQQQDEILIWIYIQCFLPMIDCKLKIGYLSIL